MVWFSCDYCGDTVKKPKLATHFSHCGSHSFNCVDCCQSFDRKGAQAHSVCLTEAQKYQLGATKPGGTHANGHAPQQQPAASKAPSEPSGLEFLSVRPPWKCSVCNISCTSQATLQSHAAGVKHKRRAKAALAAQNGGAAPATPGSDSAQPATPQQAPEQQQEGEAQQASAPEIAGEGKSSKKKKRQAPAASSEPDSEADAADASKSGQKAKKAKKGGEASEPLHPSLQDDAAMGTLQKAVQKKIKAKGSIGPKKLSKLVASKLGLEASEQLVGAVRAELVKRVSGIEEQDGFLMPVS